MEKDLVFLWRHICVQNQVDALYNKLKGRGLLSASLDKFVAFLVAQSGSGNSAGSQAQSRLVRSMGWVPEKGKVRLGDCVNPASGRILEIKTTILGSGLTKLDKKAKFQQVRLNRDVDYVLLAIDASKYAGLALPEGPEKPIGVFILSLTHAQMHDEIKSAANFVSGTSHGTKKETKPSRVGGGLSMYNISVNWYSEAFWRLVEKYGQPEAVARFATYGED